MRCQLGFVWYQHKAILCGNIEKGVKSTVVIYSVGPCGWTRPTSRSYGPLTYSGLCSAVWKAPSFTIAHHSLSFVPRRHIVNISVQGQTWASIQTSLHTDLCLGIWGRVPRLEFRSCLAKLRSHPQILSIPVSSEGGVLFLFCSTTFNTRGCVFKLDFIIILVFS